MPGKSSTFAAAVVNHVLGGPTYTPLDTLYVALFSALPATPSSAPTEVVAAGYVRASIANTPVTWGAASTDGVRTNQVSIQFGTAGAAWTVVGFGLYDALVGGNLLYYGPLAAAVTVAINESGSFPVGAMVIAET